MRQGFSPLSHISTLVLFVSLLQLALLRFSNSSQRVLSKIRTMAKAEEIVEPHEAPAPQVQEKRPSGAPARMLIYFVVAVIISLALQKAIPALDIALSCHAKVVCSGVFISHRPFEHVDISKVR